MSRFLRSSNLTILLNTQIYNKKIQKTKNIFEDNYINNTNLYLNLYYITKAKELHNLQNLTINQLRQYYATENKISSFDYCNQIYYKIKSRLSATTSRSLSFSSLTILLET